MDESLKICLAKKALEASAVLYKRQTDYNRAIEVYAQVLVEVGVELMPTMCYEIVYDDKLIDYKGSGGAGAGGGSALLEKNADIVKFDEVLGSVVKMCDKQSSRSGTNLGQEDLWKHALKNIFTVK